MCKKCQNDWVIPTTPAAGPQKKRQKIMVVKYIFHLSDIHIRLQSRHEEYKAVFHECMESILCRPEYIENPSSCILIITGDIVHSKTTLSPELVFLTNTFIEDLTKLMPVFFIAGNHDINMHNKNKIDSLSAIFPGAVVEKKIDEEITTISSSTEYCFYYLRNSGLYRYNNILFNVWSILDDGDDFMLPPITASDDLVKIGLYHGMVYGCKLSKYDDENSMMLLAHDRQGAIRIDSLPNMSNMDAVLLGDIHIPQDIENDKILTSYAGSLIQQNFGEDIEDHGYLIWDIQHFTNQFVAVRNYHHVFVTLKFDDDEHIVVPPIESFLHAKNLSFRLLWYYDSSSSLSPSILRQTKESLIRNKVLEILAPHKKIQPAMILQTMHVNYVPKKKNSTQEQTQLQQKKQQEQQQLLHMEKRQREDHSSVFNLVNPANILQTFRDELDVSAGDFKSLRVVHDSILSNTVLIEKKDGEEEAITGWRLCSVEFSNLFCFGPKKNYINFEAMATSDENKMFCLTSRNHSGKSNFLDIITFALTDTTSRAKTTEEIIRKGAKEGYVILTIRTSTDMYEIHKRLKVSSSKKVSMTTELLKYKSGEDDDEKKKKENISASTATETKKKIQGLFGSYKQLIQMSFILQDQPLGGILQLTQTERKKILCECLGLEVYENLNKAAKKMSLESSGRMKSLEKEILTMEKMILVEKKQHDHAKVDDNNNETHIETEQKSSMIKSKIDAVTKKIHSINLDLKKYNNGTTMETTEEDEITENGILELKESIQAIDTSISELRNQLHTATLAKHRKQLEVVRRDLLKLEQEAVDVSSSSDRLDRKFIILPREKKLVVEEGKDPEPGLPPPDIIASRIVTAIIHESQQQQQQQQNQQQELLQQQQGGSLVRRLLDDYVEARLLGKIKEGRGVGCTSVDIEIIRLGMEYQMILERIATEESDNTSIEEELAELTRTRGVLVHRYVIGCKVLLCQFESRRSDLQKVLEDLKRRENNIALLEKERDRYRQELISESRSSLILKLYEDIMCLRSKRSIPNKILQRIIPLLEERINGLLSFILPGSNPVTMAVTDTTWDIYLYDRRIECCSGFQRRITSFTFRIALRDLLQYSSGANASTTPICKSLFIDEAFGSVDGVYMDDLPNYLRAIAVDLDWMFIISHSEILGTLGHQIKIETDAKSDAQYIFAV